MYLNRTLNNTIPSFFQKKLPFSKGSFLEGAKSSQIKENDPTKLIANQMMITNQILHNMAYQLIFLICLLPTFIFGNGYDMHGTDNTAPFFQPPATISVRVNQDSDDAEEEVLSGNIDLESSDLELINDDGIDQIVGMRFESIAIPQGATITNAYIEFEADDTDNGSTSLSIFGQDINHAATFLSSNGNISARIKTTANVSWNNVPAWNSKDEKHQTPDLSNIVQEIVNRSGWASGNSMAFIVEGSGVREVESYDGESNAAPLLIITYSSSVVVEICDNGIDDDDDGDIDLNDTDCQCSTPNFIFQNYSLAAGTAGLPGAVYSFSDVLPGVDALITIASFSHNDIVILSIDEPEATNGGYDWAFQPIIDYNWLNGDGSYDSGGDKSVTFQFDFVDAISGTPVTVPIMHMTAVDVDGNGADIREFVESSGFQSHETQAPSDLTLSGALRALGPLVAFQGVVETALSTMISYKFDNASSVILTYGANYDGN